MAPALAIDSNRDRLEMSMPTSLVESDDNKNYM